MMLFGELGPYDKTFPTLRAPSMVHAVTTKINDVYNTLLAASASLLGSSMLTKYQDQFPPHLIVYNHRLTANTPTRQDLPRKQESGTPS